MHASVCYYSELNSEDRSRAVLRGVSQGGPTLWYPNITSLQSEKAPWKLIYKLKPTSKVVIKPTGLITNDPDGRQFTEHD